VHVQYKETSLKSKCKNILQ